MIHWRHFDGWPLCWPMDREGAFEASSVEAEVTCPDCRRYLQE